MWDCTIKYTVADIKHETITCVEVREPARILICVFLMLLD